jgi:hypothetical protein
MSDVVHCKCLLKKMSATLGVDLLYLVCPPDFNLRIIPCRPKGEAQRQEKRPEWQYQEIGGRLNLQPSLRCLDTQFHTAFDWSVDYEVCPDGVSAYNRFFALNPSVRQKE